MAESPRPPTPSTEAGVQTQQPQAEMQGVVQTQVMHETASPTPQAQTQQQPQPQTQPPPSSLSSTVQPAEQPQLQRQQQHQLPQQPQQPQSSQPSASAELPAASATPTLTDDMTSSNSKDDVVMGGTDADGTAQAGAPGASKSQPAPGAGMNALEAGAVAPTKKDTSLREFLGQMDEYAPIIPDAVTAHYLTVAGLPPPGNGPNQTPPHLARLLALATQKFIADISADAYQYARIRNSNSSSNTLGAINVAAGLNVSGAGAAGGAGGAGGGDTGKGKAAGLHLGVQRPGYGGGGQGGSQGKTVLTMEDLGMAVAEYGVSVKRGEFYR